MVSQSDACAPTRAGTGTADRLDPFTLPVRFAAPDPYADGGERRVTVDSGRVVVDRMVRRIAMRIVAPLSTFTGVAMRVAPGADPREDQVEVVLVAALADIAVEVNASVENIGARRLQTVMERVLDEISFTA
ncbi:hypothetical protein ACIKT0_13750, partial [Hansschlegelia beijingensis]